MTTKTESIIRETIVKYKTKRIKPSTAITNAEVAADAIRQLLPDNSREHFITLHLNSRNEIASYSLTATGSASQCGVHPREVFQPAILAGSIGVLIAHNHPSGCTEPSAEDKEVTSRIIDAGKLLGIKVLDSLIVTDTECRSLCN